MDPDILSGEKRIKCPSCNEPLQIWALKCSKCDWIAEPKVKVLNNFDNKVAAFLNIIPGLGHFYKGHIVKGLVILFVGMPLAMVAGIILIVPTAGLSLFFPFLLWGWSMWEVQLIQDRPRFRQRFL